MMLLAVQSVAETALYTYQCPQVRLSDPEKQWVTLVTFDQSDEETFFLPLGDVHTLFLWNATHLNDAWGYQFMIQWLFQEEKRG